MTDINSVILVGRTTRDAELRYTENGTGILNFSIAVNESRKNGEQWIEEASFFDVTLFGKMAESLKQYLAKGKQVGISGRLQQQRWEQDGQPRSKVVVIANAVQLLGGRTGEQAVAPQQAYGQYSAKAQAIYRANPPQTPQGTWVPQQPYGGGQVQQQREFSGLDDFPDDIPF